MELLERLLVGRWSLDAVGSTAFGKCAAAAEDFSSAL